MPGAARLALAAASSSGVGLATAAVPPGSAGLYAGDAPGTIVREVDGAAGLTSLLADSRFSATVVGPGLGGGEARALVTAALATGRPVLIDADGIGAFAWMCFRW